MSFFVILSVFVINSTSFHMKYGCAHPLKKWKAVKTVMTGEAGQNNTGHQGELKIVKETNDLWFFLVLRGFGGVSGEVHENQIHFLKSSFNIKLSILNSLLTNK